jgi:hypothetical protein
MESILSLSITPKRSKTPITLKRNLNPELEVMLSYDFERMYNNLIVLDCLCLLERLTYKFCNMTPDEEFDILAFLDAKSKVFNVLIWQQLHKLNNFVWVPIIVFKLLDLLTLCLIEFSFYQCHHVPGLFKQMLGITMGNNTSPLFANFALSYVELSNLKTLNSISPFFCRYLNDILVPTSSLVDLLLALMDFCQPVSLQLLPSPPFLDEKVPYLDI